MKKQTRTTVYPVCTQMESLVSGQKKEFSISYFLRKFNAYASKGQHKLYVPGINQGEFQCYINVGYLKTYNHWTVFAAKIKIN